MNEFNNMPNNNMPNMNMYGPMKKCKHCQCDIPVKAKICPNCKKKQGKGCLPVVAIVVGVIIILAAVGGSGDSSKEKESNIKVDKGGASTSSIIEKEEASEKKETEKTEEKNNKEEKETTKEVPKEEPKEDTEPESSDRIEVKAGDSLETKELKISINEINTDYQVKDDEWGLYELDDEHKYISASFTFENISDSDVYVSVYDFDCYADDATCEQKFLPEDDFINTNISKGRKVSFTAFYAVPKNAESIELEYTEGFFNTGETIYVIVK